ncbi:MAG: YbaB/EbfC family nucleoid-associated protein [Akkermansia sp.]|nr:YbaB/EbfC family nucleoid-associated protein [Akkermansia sp.]MDO4751997.1 YbaB/EbfC family nucleoid-associated protein [Akkermansia sp.]
MNLQKLMKQAQAMQANMANAQARLAEKNFTAEAAGGKIKVTANGTGMITELSIDPAVIDPDDAEFLSSLVLKAVQDALNGAKDMADAEMRKVTGGLGFPM